MKSSPLKIILLVLLGGGLAGVILMLIFSGGKSRAQRAVEKVRQEMRQQGFKTDLADYDFKTDLSAQRRENTITFSSGIVHQATPLEMTELFPAVTDDSVCVVWQQDWLKADYEDIRWPDLRDGLEEIRLQLNSACETALSGPIRFNLDASRGSAMLLRPLAPLKKLTQLLGCRTVLDLHDGNLDAAWTNLMAATRLVSAWQVEPVEISQFVRFGEGSLTFNAFWQALQTNGWSDGQLARLQQEWESVDYFKNLPETVEFKCACAVADCQGERGRTVLDGMSFGEFIKGFWQSPRDLWPFIREYKKHLGYAQHGSYEDEKNLLLFYRDRAAEIRNALHTQTWSAMRQLPGVTNQNFFQSTNSSRFQSMMNIREMGVAMQRGRLGLLGRAAEAEVRRRILITALALQRYRSQHGSYPNSLAGLVPEFLKAVPLDFMDGQPLRYRLKDDGHFLLYSIGVDCVDNGGKMRPPKQRTMFDDGRDYMGMPPETDIVWPRPATVAETTQWRAEQLAARQNQTDEPEKLQTIAQWEHTTRHQAGAGSVLTETNPQPLPEINFHGRALKEILSNALSSGTNKLSLSEMLTLKQIITGDEPETVTFELPIAYSALTNLGSLRLMLDTNNDDWDGGCHAQQVECKRNDTNGNSLLVWSTLYESPGLHAVFAGLTVNELPPETQDFYGPFLAHTITNLCQFSLSSATYEVETGALFHARLPEPNGNYSIECLTTNGAHLKTLTSSTTNGEFKVVWDLVADDGYRMIGETFNSAVKITLPDSGRTQTLRGP